MVLEFQVKDCVSSKGEKATLVEFSIPGGVLAPSALSELSPPQVNPRQGVILSGRGPIWLYAFLVHHYHPTPWIGVFDPRLGGAVIVQSHSPGFKAGDLFELQSP